MNTRLAALIAALVLPGCLSTGKMEQSTGTGVTLAGNNYKLVKAGARGTDSGFWLLGLIPLGSPSYADAKDDLYDAIEQPLEGRSIALTNLTQDQSVAYYILFSIPTITLTADVVEFQGETRP